MTDETEDPQALGDLVTQFAQRFPHLADDFQAGVEAGRSGGRKTETDEDAAERQRQRQEFYLARWQAMVPVMYADATLEGLAEDQRVRWPAESLNLALAGNVGTGKTHTAYAWGNHLAAQGYWVAGALVHDLLDALRPGGEDRALAYAAPRCQVLILDDLGAGVVTPWAIDTMTSLVDQRLREKRRTILTTNATSADLEAAWGGRLMDRLRFRRTVHVFRGQSRREDTW